MCLIIFQKGNNLFQTIKNRKLKQSKIWTLPRVHGFNQKFENFPSFQFFAKSVSIMRLKIFQKRKKLFQTIKNTKLRQSRIAIFQKGLVHAFGQTYENFPSFYFGKISQQNVFDDILEMKKAFLDYKKPKLKKVKTWDFSKGVSPWFW